MTDEQWAIMEVIVEYLFVGMVAILLGIFVIGTICRLICMFMRKDNKFKYFFSRPLVVYTINRTKSALVTIVLVTVATFLLLRMLPDDIYYMGYLNKITDEGRKAAAIANARAKFGLDQPVIKQLLDYFYNVLPIKKEICVSTNLDTLDSGELVWSCSEYKTVFINLGSSMALRPNVLITDILYERAAVSFVIGFIACVGQIVIGYPLGVWMASKKDKFIDKFGRIYSVLVDAIPAIVYYFLIMVFFQRTLALNTFFNRYDMSTWIVPLVSLLIAGIPGIAIWVRRYMIDEINSDYVKFAKAKGLSKNKIMFVHVLRNAVVPLVRTIPSAFIFSLLGSYYVEKIYAIPGLGQTLLNSIQEQDNPLVQGLVIIFAFVSTFAYLIGDIATALADPRVSLMAEDK